MRFDWVLPWSSLPRRVVPARPLDPMGTTYLYVPVDVAVRGSLAFRAEWEPPAAFQWVIALLDADGGLLRRVDVPYQERATSVERTVADPSGAAGILVVGANLGGLGPSYPFDPDFEPLEPRSFSVYLTEI
ncbi:MAG: hypothetical protein FJ104_17540 [Deltaproteobacteria bacterium]|nr:hypothetical protein [Deltaproteobacteria bacterium]